MKLRDLSSALADLKPFCCAFFSAYTRTAPLTRSRVVYPTLNPYPHVVAPASKDHFMICYPSHIQAAAELYKPPGMVCGTLEASPHPPRLPVICSAARAPAIHFSDNIQVLHARLLGRFRGVLGAPGGIFFRARALLLGLPLHLLSLALRRHRLPFNQGIRRAVAPLAPALGGRRARLRAPAIGLQCMFGSMLSQWFSALQEPGISTNLHLQVHPQGAIERTQSATTCARKTLAKGSPQMSIMAEMTFLCVCSKHHLILYEA